MFRIIICIVTFLFFFKLVLCIEQNRVLEPTEYPRATLLNMRCTRRFSPGVCVDEVAPVWTFVFMAQNCTERLGCTNSFRSNRFRSYRLCMKRCRILIDKYLELVELQTPKNASKSGNESSTSDEERNDNNDTAGGDDKNLREGLAKYFKMQMESLKQETGNYDDVEEDDYYGTQQNTRYIVYKDNMNANENIMPPDVDDIPGEIRSEFDNHVEYNV